MPHSHLKRRSSQEDLDFPSDPAEYTLDKQIGKGVSSTVWHASCKRHNCDVAIKIVDLEKSEEGWDLVMQEAHTLHTQHHPNLLPLLACFLQGCCLWLVLPCMAGGSVSTLLQHSFPEGLPETAIAAIMKEALKGIEYLHQHHIIHRDIKAGNILLGEEGQVVVADLGVAATLKLQADACCGSSYLQRHSYVGSPGWMAPEVLVNESGYALKADIWSFGMTLLEVAQGHAPFASVPFEVLVLSVVNGPTPGLEEDPDCPEHRFSKELQEVISACLTKQADARPTASELLKFKFFKNASGTKHREQVVKGLLADLPSLEERLEELKERPLRSTSFKLARTSTGGAPGPSLVREASSARRKLQSRPSSNNLHPRDLGPQEAMMLLARLKPSPTLTSQASSSALHKLSKVLPFIHVSDEGPHLPAEVIRAARGVGFVAGWRGSLGVRHAWSYGFAMAKLSDSPTEGSTWSGPSFYYLADSGMGGVGYERRQAVLILCTDEAVAKFKNPEGFKLSELKLENHYSGTLDARHVLHNIEKYQAKKTPYVIAMRFNDGGVLFASTGGQSTPSRASIEAAYGAPHSTADILNGKVAPPEAFNDVIQALIQIEQVAISRSRAASPSPSCQRLDLLGLEGGAVAPSPPSSDPGASALRHTSPDARHDVNIPPRKSPLSKQGSADGSSSCPPDFTFNGLTSAQWGLQFADPAAAGGSSAYGSEVGSVGSVDHPTLGSPVRVLQQAVPGSSGVEVAAETPTLRMGPFVQQQQQQAVLAPPSGRSEVESSMESPAASQHNPEIPIPIPVSPNLQAPPAAASEGGAAKMGTISAHDRVQAPVAEPQSYQDDDNEPAVTHHPNPGVLLSEEQQRARSHPYPHDVLRAPTPPVAPGRGMSPRPPLSRLGRSASNSSHERDPGLAHQQPPS